MYGFNMYVEIRKACLRDGLSIRAAADKYKLHRSTIKKMLGSAIPADYSRRKEIKRPAIDAHKEFIDEIIISDKKAPRKQRHTIKRIFDRLCDERQYKGSYTAVRRYIRLALSLESGTRINSVRETYVPLIHEPGTAQADFGKGLAILAGQETTVHLFVMDLPFSDGCFVKAYRHENGESLCDGHVSAFTFFKGVPLNILYDNTTIIISNIFSNGQKQRQYTQIFAHLQSYYLFEAKFARVRRGNEKGSVENLVGFARRNFMVPIPNFADIDELNKHLESCCRKRQQSILRGHSSSIAVRMIADQKAFIKLPAHPYEPCSIKSGRVNKVSLVRYDNNDYSVPSQYAYRSVLIKSYVDKIVICYEDKEIANHKRSCNKEEVVYDPRHYLAVIERKINSLDQAAPMVKWQSELPSCFKLLRARLEARDGKQGKRSYVQILKLLIEFKIDTVTIAVEYGLAKGIIDPDSIKHLILAQIDKRPAALDQGKYPHLPRLEYSTKPNLALYDNLMTMAGG